MDDIIPQQKPPAQTAPPKRRGCLRRLIQLAFLVIVGGACLFGLSVYRTRTSPPFTTALELVKSDPKLMERLGEPLRDTRWLPSGPYPEQFNLRIAGPEGTAEVSVRARQFEGEWALTAVDAVILDGGERLSLDTGGENGLGDAPTWSPSGGAGPAEEGQSSPPDVDLQLPDGPPGIHIELPETPPDLNIEMPAVPPPPGS